LVHGEEGVKTCQVANPGDTTYIDYPESHFCPAYEKQSAKKLNNRQKKESVVD
jgi:hypothetical protein